MVQDRRNLERAPVPEWEKRCTAACYAAAPQALAFVERPRVTEGRARPLNKPSRLVLAERPVVGTLTNARLFRKTSSSGAAIDGRSRSRLRLSVT
jgi:hypothetical protein